MIASIFKNYYQISLQMWYLNSKYSFLSIIINFQHQEMMMTDNYQVYTNQVKLIQNKKHQQFFINKIEKRLKATIKSNKKKEFLNKFTLRNCCVDDEIPDGAIKLLINCPKLKKLRDLQLTEMNLRFLKNIPNFPLLLKLDLTMNNINDEQIKYIFIYQNLEVLYLTQNFIKNVQTVGNLKNFRKLKELDISANPVDSLIQRSQIFDLMPGLKTYNRYLRSGRDLERNDLFTQSDEEQDESSEEQNQNNFNQDCYEPSDIIYDSEDQQQKRKFCQQIDEQAKKKQDSQQIQQMIDESESSQVVVPPKRQKKLNQMSNLELKLVYEQSKKRLKKLFQQMR